MKTKETSSGKKSSLVLYLFVTAVLLILVAGFYFITTYYPLKYREEIEYYSEKYHVEPALVCAVISTESRFSAEAKSEKGALGLMQMMPETGDWIAGKLGKKGYSEERLLEPELNIEFGAWYLDFLSDRFHGDRELIAAAYNAGHGNVEKWLSDPEYSENDKLTHIPYEETRNYVKKVNFAYEIYKTFYHFD